MNLTKGVDGKTLDMDIRYKSQLVGYAEFALSGVDDSWISYRERNSSKAFNQTLAMWFEDDDSAEYCFCVSLAMMMAADPSLSKSDAIDFMSSLVYPQTAACDALVRRARIPRIRSFLHGCYALVTKYLFRSRIPRPGFLSRNARPGGRKGTPCLNRKNQRKPGPQRSRAGKTEPMGPAMSPPWHPTTSPRP